MSQRNNNKRFQALIQLPNHLPQISIDRSLTALVVATPHRVPVPVSVFFFFFFVSFLFFTCDVHLKDRDAVCGAACTCSKLCFKRFSCCYRRCWGCCLFRVFCFYGSDCLAFHFHVAQFAATRSCSRSRSLSVCGLHAPARGATVICIKNIEIIKI